MAEKKGEVEADRVGRALASDVPRIYFNGFVITLSTGDVACILERHGQPVGIINMSYTLAKTLSTSLTQTITSLEEASHQPIMTTHEVGQYIDVLSKASKSAGPSKKQPKQSRAKRAKNA